MYQISTKMRKAMSAVFTAGFLLLGAWLGGNVNAQYCTPTMSNKCCNIGNKSVTFGANLSYTIGNYQQGTQYYDEFNTVSACVNAGKKYQMEVTVWPGPYYQAVCVWIDWNKNNTFDVGEIQMDTNYLAPGSTLSDSVLVPAGQATGEYRMRVMTDYNWYYKNNGQAYNPCQGYYYGDYIDFKLTVVSNSGLDLAMASIIQPTVLAIGNNNQVQFYYRNVSATKIDSFRAGYQFNGGTPFIEKVTTNGGGNALALATCEQDNYSFSQNFAVSTAGNYELKVWVSHANGTQPDDDKKNDTIIYQACTSLSGNYTIDGSKASSGSNYTSFADAGKALGQCGISGPVTFTVAPGTYSESMSIPAINGSSSANTVTFNGVDDSTRVITSSNSYTIRLDGADYIKIKNLGIVNTSTGFSVAMHITKEGDYNYVDSCTIQCNTTGQGIGYGVCSNTSQWTSGDFGEYNTINHTEVIDAYTSFALQGTGQNSLAQENKILNCNGHGARYMGLMCYYQNLPEMIGNKFLCKSYYGAYMYFPSNIIFNRNEVTSTYYGVMGYYMSDGQFNNNMIYGSQYYSVYAYQATNMLMYHNTALNDQNTGYGFYINAGNGNDFRNNIIQANGSTGFTLYAGSTGSFNLVESNNYYAPNSSNFAYLGTAYANKASMMAQNGLNNQMYSEQSNFINTTAGTYDLHLSSAVQSLSGDGTTGVTVDIDGDARCTLAPSLGCDESKFPIALPVSNFAIPDTAYIGSPFKALNSAGPNEGKGFEWYLNGSANLFTTSRNTEVTFYTTGLHCMKLKTINCSGSHDTTKCLYIVNPPTKPVAAFIADKNVIEPNDEVIFTDLSSVGPTGWEWTITPGTIGVDWDYTQGAASSSQSPSVQFFTPGSYEICLIANNNQGYDTICKPGYIDVLAAEFMCQNSSSNLAKAKFYDDGGKTGNYSTGQLCTFLIDPCAKSVTLTFTSFQTINNVGFLRIYDGANATTGKAFHTGQGFTGSNLIGPFTASSGKIFLEWRSNNQGGKGWEAAWNSTPGNVTSPSSAFTANKSGWVGGIHNFDVKNYDPNSTYEWTDCQGNNYGYGPNLQYPFQAGGQYTVCLTATNCAGSTTTTDTITIQAPNAAPTADFKANVSSNTSLCNVAVANIINIQYGDTVQLLDLSNQGANDWSWNATPSANVTWIDAQTDQNPRVTFTKAGNYSVTLDATNGIGTGSTTKNNFIKVLPPYCTPAISQTVNDISISRVIMGSIDNSSKVDQFTVYNQSACMDRGARYPFWVSRNSNQNPINRKVWADWNQDGDYADAGELIASQSSSNSLTWADTLKVPVNATLGATRLRVGVSFGNNSNTACGPNNFGEFEEYNLFITEDVTPPIVTLLGNTTITIGKCESYRDSLATGWDAVDGPVNAVLVSNNVDTTTLGTYSVIYTAYDAAGNKANNVTRTVIVVADKVGPVITLNGNNPLNMDVNTTYTEPGAVAVDACDGTLPPSSITRTGSVTATTIGTYTLSYDAADNSGNAATTVTRTVNVGDFTAPVITLGGNNPLTWPVGTTYVDPAGTGVTDNYYTSGLTISNDAATSVNTNILGSYTVTYSCTDPSGNKGTATRTVNVTDAVAPTLILIGGETLTVEAVPSGNWVDKGSYATDNYYPSITVTPSGTVDLSVISTIANPYQTISYTATDGSGNTTNKTRYVEVKKTTKPLLTVVGNSIMKICRWSTFTDAGVTITDSYYPSAQLMPLLSKTMSGINTQGEGTYAIGYVVTDPMGNRSDTVWRVVTVAYCANGIAQIEENNVKVYPNPSNGIFNIEIQPNTYNKGFVMNMNGQVVKTFKIVANKMEMDLSTLADGTYIFNLQGEAGSVKKVVTLTK